MSSESFSLLVDRSQEGNRTALNDLYQFVFPRLRKIASSLLRLERPEHTLQPTALVSEVFLKLHRMQARILGEEHFFHIAARAMRQVLIDHARIGKRKKNVPLEAIPELLLESHDDVANREWRMAVRSVFGQLQAVDPLAASTVWLRSVEGQTIEEVCRLQSRARWHVRTDYDFGVKWMAKRLRPYGFQ